MGKVGHLERRGGVIGVTKQLDVSRHNVSNAANDDIT